MQLNNRVWTVKLLHMQAAASINHHRPNLIRCAAFLLSFALFACVQEHHFSYRHPNNPRQLLKIDLYRSPNSEIRLIIDGRLVMQKKLDFTSQSRNPWMLVSEAFENTTVVLSCFRQNSHDTFTMCDFSIGEGEHVMVPIK